MEQQGHPWLRAGMDAEMVLSRVGDGEITSWRLPRASGFPRGSGKAQEHDFYLHPRFQAQGATGRARLCWPRKRCRCICFQTDLGRRGLCCNGRPRGGSVRERIKGRTSLAVGITTQGEHGPREDRLRHRVHGAGTGSCVLSGVSSSGSGQAH